MNEQRSYRRLFEMLEAALADVGCFVTATKRVQMANLLDRVDQVTTRDDAEALNAEFEHHISQSLPSGCDPAVWLGTAECA